MVGEILGETTETIIHVDIVDDNDSTRPQERPGRINLESDVSFAVQTIVNENVDPYELGKETR